MEDYTLVQQFLLIGLDGTDSRHKSVAKSAVLRAAAAGKRAERLLASGDCQSPGFADKLEKATIDTIESGKMTKDLALITTLENPTVLNSEDFIKAIAEKLKED